MGEPKNLSIDIRNKNQFKYPQEVSFLNFVHCNKPLSKRLKNTRKLSFRATPAKAGGDPESRIFGQFWIPAFAGMTEEVISPETPKRFRNSDFEIRYLEGLL